MATKFTLIKFEYDDKLDLHEALCKLIHEGDEGAQQDLETCVMNIQYVTDVSEKARVSTYDGED